MQKVTIPLIGNVTIRNLLTQSSISSSKGQIFQNCDFTPFENPFTGDKSLKISKRLGYLEGSSLSTFTTVSKIWSWWGYNNNAGAHVYTGTDSATGKDRIEVVPDGGGGYGYAWADLQGNLVVSEAKNSSGTDCILIVRNYGTGGYYIYPRGGAVSSITVPSGCVTEMVTIKGWTFVGNKDGKIYNSALNDPTSGYSDFIGADLFPDGVTYLIGFKNYLYAFGPDSMEVFEVVENTSGSPLRYIPQMHQRVGISYGSTYKHCFGNNALYFIGANPGIKIFELVENGTLNEISTDYLIDYFPTTLRFGKWGSKNRLIVPVTLDGENGAFVYNFDLKLWHYWRGPGNWATVNPSLYSTFIGSEIIYQSNKLARVLSYPYSSVSYKDDTVDITRRIITSPLSFGSNNNKVIHYVKLIGDVATSTANVSISWSDDDGQTFNTAQTVDLSSANPAIWGCGNTRRRIFKLEDTLNGEYRIEALEIGYSEGTN